VIRALYVAYFFPPIGGAGVQRTLKFVRYLPETGVVPIVVTGPTGSSGRWVPEDRALEREVSPKARVVRASGPEPPEAVRWQARADRWLRRPTSWTRWWTRQVVACGRTIEDADVLLASMSPFQSATAVARLAIELDVPWVADLRDPWALDEMTTWPSALHRRLELRKMRRALSSAAAVVMNTDTAAERVQQQFPEFRAKHIVAIPNGFDKQDFLGPEPTRTDGTFRIVHTGYLHTELGLEQRHQSPLRRAFGGAVRGVDFLTRSHVVLLEALDRVATDHPAIAKQLELVLVGVLSDADRAVIGGRPYVHELGYVSHDRSVELVRSADLLFLPMHDLPLGTRATIIPGKTYEYLASGRPVLAAVPDGDARDLLGRVAETTICRPADVSAMAAAIARLVARGRVPSVERPELGRYERRELTRELAGVLRSAVEGFPADRFPARQRPGR
jgi:glycosyltransferase involved in cell wall biosynthesis